MMIDTATTIAIADGGVTAGRAPFLGHACAAGVGTLGGFGTLGDLSAFGGASAFGGPGASGVLLANPAKRRLASRS